MRTSVPRHLSSPLMPGAVHVVCANLSEVADSLARRAVPLSEAERDRARRFHCAEHRWLFESRRQLLKLLIGRYLRIPAASVELETGAWGKPHVARVDLQFSVSRSGDRVMYAFTRARHIGIDLEGIRRGIESMDIAARFFSVLERKFLESLPEHERETAFYRIWTRKEAYVKALGGGLRIPLDSFAVSTSDVSGPALAWSADADAAGRWLLFSLEPFPAHVGAVVVERPTTGVTDIRVDSANVEALGER